MQKIIYAILAVLVITGSGLAISYSKKLKKCETDLEACKKVPDFTPALMNVKEFTGLRKRIHFKIQCSNDIDFDFFDTNKCKILIDEDVTNEDVSLTYDNYRGRTCCSRYIVDWLEYWNFSVDLSNSSDWKVEIENKTITFNAPQIKVTRIADSGKNYLLYSVDRAVWRNDHKALNNIASKTDDFAIIKSNNYLSDNYTDVKNAMDESIKGFIKTLITRLGYQEGYNIIINFEDL